MQLVRSIGPWNLKPYVSKSVFVQVQMFIVNMVLTWKLPVTINNFERMEQDANFKVKIKP